MCGIAGTFRLDGSAQPEDRAAVAAMSAAQRHRGPDGDGILERGSAVLGHRRLSILDLSAAGAQPMCNETSDVWITFNGEIYNYREIHEQLDNGHRFRSGADTEVLLHGYEEWGLDGLLSRVCGMFAFGLLDTRRGSRLFLVRDRLGIKPLYYANHSKRVAFASEVKALRHGGDIGNGVDRDALLGMMCFGSVPSPRTALKDVHCLPPGHYLSVGSDGVRETRYWSVDGSAPLPAALFSPQALLREVVKGHLISDVPLGVFLSAGLDSSGLTAVASGLKQSLETLTMRFEEAAFDEGDTAGQIARHYRTNHHEVRLREEHFIAELPAILAATDQPSVDGVNTYFVCRAARNLGLKVALSGLGGDEVFYGYPHHHPTLTRRLLSGFLSLPAPLRRLGASAATTYGALAQDDRWNRFAYAGDSSPAHSLYMAVRGLAGPAAVARLFGCTLGEVKRVVESAFGAGSGFPNGDSTSLPALNANEYRLYLHDQLLRDSDVFSMAHSIELRIPYLDHRLVEYAWSLPSGDKLSAKSNKPKLVELIGDAYISSLASAPKRGFTFPFEKWMQSHSRELEALATAGSILDARELRQLWDRFRAGRLHWSRVWATVSINTAGAIR